VSTFDLADYIGDTPPKHTEQKQLIDGMEGLKEAAISGVDKLKGFELCHIGTGKWVTFSCAYVTPLLAVGGVIEAKDQKLRLDGSLLDGLLPFLYTGDVGSIESNGCLYVTFGESGLVVDEWAKEVPDNSRLQRMWRKKIGKHVDSDGSFKTEQIVIGVFWRCIQHYTLLVVNPTTREMVILDSLHSVQHAISPKEKDRALVFGNWLDNKGDLIKGQEGIHPWKVERGYVPCQVDNYLCGYVACLKVMELMSPEDGIEKEIEALCTKQKGYYYFRDQRKVANFILNEIFKHCKMFSVIEKKIE
jgi:hypothetical protein